MKRWKELYEAEHPQTKAGGDKKSETAKENQIADSATRFTKDIAEKINKSERVVQEEVQIATRIPEAIQEKIKDLAICRECI